MDRKNEDPLLPQFPGFDLVPAISVDDASCVHPVIARACAYAGHGAKHLLTSALRPHIPVRKQNGVQASIQAAGDTLDEEESALAAEDRATSPFGYLLIREKSIYVPRIHVAVLPRTSGKQNHLRCLWRKRGREIEVVRQHYEMGNRISAPGSRRSDRLRSTDAGVAPARR